MKSYVDTKVIKVYNVMDNMEIRIHEGGVVTYYYKAGDDMAFEFGLLSEVGEVWRRIFLKYYLNSDLYISHFETEDYVGERIIQ